MAGAHIPLIPMVHQMIDVGPVPRFEELARDRVPDRPRHGRLHVRAPGRHEPEIGSYAHRSIVHDPEEIPSIEAAALSPTEFPFTQADFDPQMVDALDLMPEIVGDESVGVKYAINGLISLTPDGMPILGETPEVKGLWSAAAVWVKEGLGVGKSVAEWMVHGESHIDLHSSDVARFHDHQKTRAHVKARTIEAFPKTYGIIHPAEQWGRTAASALADARARAGARGRLLRGRRAGAAALVRGECSARRALRHRAARGGRAVVVADHQRRAPRDARARRLVRPLGVRDLRRHGWARSTRCSAGARADGRRRRRVVYTPVLSPGGGFRSDLTIMRLGEEEFRIVTGGAHGMADRKLFADQLPDDGSAGLGTSRPPGRRSVSGGRARDILGASPRTTCPTRVPVRDVQDDRDRLAARPRVADLLRRRPGLGALRPDRAGRPPLGRCGRPAARTTACGIGVYGTTGPPRWRSATAPSPPSSRASTRSWRPACRGPR